MTKTSNYFFIGAFITVLFAGLFTFVSADTVVRTGETVSLAEDQGVEGDFYTAASIINISAGVNGDLTAAGGRITLNGNVEGDALVLGGSVDVHGAVADDLRVVGGEVVIAEPVTGDVFVIGGTVSILSTASVGGDVLIYGGDVEISGPVGGDVLGHSGTLRIDSEVAGDVDVTTNTLTLGDRASIEGSVVYVSSELVTRSQNATVGGDVVRNDPVMENVQTGVKATLIPLLITLFTVLVWYLVARNLLSKVVDSAVSRRPRPLLLGLGTLLLAPFAIIILMVSVLGTLVGLIGMFSYILLVLLGIVGVSAVAGHVALKIFNQPVEGVNLYSLGVGVIAVTLLWLLPVIGPIVLFGLFLVTLGAVIEVTIYPASE